MLRRSQDGETVAVAVEGKLRIGNYGRFALWSLERPHSPELGMVVVVARAGGHCGSTFLRSWP